MCLFRKAVRAAVALADDLSLSVLCSEELRYFLKGRAPSSLEEPALGGRDSVSNTLKTAVILLKIFSYFQGGSCMGFVGTSLWHPLCFGASL